MARKKTIEKTQPQMYQLEFPSPLRVTAFEIAFVLNRLGIQVTEEIYNKFDGTVIGYFRKVE